MRDSLVLAAGVAIGCVEAALGGCSFSAINQSRQASWYRLISDKRFSYLSILR